MKRLLRGRNFKNVAELKEELTSIWKATPLEFVQKLVMSMHKRTSAVYRFKGSHSSY